MVARASWAPDELAQLADHYGIDAVEQVWRLGGLSAQNWLLVTATGRYLVKCFAPSASSQHEATAVLLQRLAEASFPSPRCIVKKGRGVGELRLGERACALFGWREGEVRHGSALSVGALQAVAQVLARLHALGPTLARGVPALRTVPSREAAPAFAALQAWQAEQKLGALPAQVQQAIARSLGLKGAILRTPAPTGTAHCNKAQDLVHGDFHNENVLFDRLGNVSGFVDFESAGLGDGVDDVFTFVLLGCCATGFGAEELVRARAFVHAYRAASGRPLDDEALGRGWHRTFFRLATSLFFEERALRGARDALPYLHRDVARMQAYLERRETLIEALRA